MPRLASHRSRLGLVSGSVSRRPRLQFAWSSPRLALASPRPHLGFALASARLGLASPRLALIASPRVASASTRRTRRGLACAGLVSAFASASPRLRLFLASASPRPLFGLASVSALVSGRVIVSSLTRLVVTWRTTARGLAPGPGDCRGVARQSVAWVRVVKLTKRLVRAWALPC